MVRRFEVLFYSGWQDVPSYYLVDNVEGRSPRHALTKQLSKVIRNVREQFLLPSDVGDDYICESLYVLRSNALVPASDVAA